MNNVTWIGYSIIKLKSIFVKYIIETEVIRMLYRRDLCPLQIRH